jgi:hypothetical protein
VLFDLTQLKAEQLEALVEHLDELTVEVDQPTRKSASSASRHRPVGGKGGH